MLKKPVKKPNIAGNTRIEALRAIYGDSFAAGFSGNAKLADVIEKKGNAALRVRPVSSFVRTKLS